MSAHRLPGLPAALALLVVAGTAAAQTVVATDAPPNTPIEFVLNGVVAGTAPASAEGTVSIPAPQTAALTGDLDAFVFVDTCADRRRVVIIDRNRDVVAPPAGCTRQQVTGLFVVRPVSSVVVTMKTPPTLMLLQGPYDPAKPPRKWVAVPGGLFAHGGAGFTFLDKASDLACGTLSVCTGDDTGFGFTAGAGFWLTPYLGAEASYLRPSEMSATGGGQTYQFTSSLETDVFTVVGMVGAPVGRARIYGMAGATYVYATSTTTQTNSDITYTIDGVTQTIAGGTERLEAKVGGWGWLFGGGFELWVSDYFAVYSEGGWGALKGSDLNPPGQALIDDRLIYIMGGGRFHIPLWK